MAASVKSCTSHNSAQRHLPDVHVCSMPVTCLDHGCSIPYLERLPSLCRARDVHDRSSTQHVVGVPDLDAIIAHHLSVLEGNLFHLAPVIADEERIPHIIGMHHKQEDHALVHVAQGVAKDKDECQED